jgi:hypothetical protein
MNSIPSRLSITSYNKQDHLTHDKKKPITWKHYLYDPLMSGTSSCITGNPTTFSTIRSSVNFLISKKMFFIDKEPVTMTCPRTGTLFIAGTFLAPVLRRLMSDYSDIVLFIDLISVGVVRVRFELVFDSVNTSKRVRINTSRSMGCDAVLRHLCEIVTSFADVKINKRSGLYVSQSSIKEIVTASKTMIIRRLKSLRSKKQTLTKNYDLRISKDTPEYSDTIDRTHVEIMINAIATILRDAYKDDKH